MAANERVAFETDRFVPQRDRHSSGVLVFIAACKKRSGGCWPEVRLRFTPWQSSSRPSVHSSSLYNLNLGGG